MTEPTPLEPTPLEPLEYTFSPLELFLFSAAGWHPHRIHFDQDYTRETEGHPDLLVHGPLQVVHLCRYLTQRIGGGQIRSLTSRHLAPLFVGVPAILEGVAKGSGEGRDTVRYEVWMRTRDDERRTTVCEVEISLSHA